MESDVVTSAKNPQVVIQLDLTDRQRFQSLLKTVTKQEEKDYGFFRPNVDNRAIESNKFDPQKIDITNPGVKLRMT